MKTILFILFMLVLFHHSYYAKNEDYLKECIQPMDSIKDDTTQTNYIYPVNIFYEFLGSSVWMSLNYQQTLFSKNRYSLDFLTGINNWEFGAFGGLGEWGKLFSTINSHYFLLNRFSNKTKRFFIEFGPGLKLSGNLGERKLGHEFSWNTSIMKVFKNHLFIKFNTTFSLSLYKYQLFYEEPNSEATYFYGYPSFPIGLSLGYRFDNSKKLSNQNKIRKLPTNMIGINSILGLSYDRLIFKKNNHALYLSVNPNFYMFKFEINKETGTKLILYDRNFINYVHQINSTVNPEFGVGYTYFDTRYIIYDEMISLNTSQINLNMGIQIMPTNHFIIKINYSPAIWASNYNLTDEQCYIYHQLDQSHAYQIANKFFITLGYAW